jgi:hypothetical protein
MENLVRHRRQPDEEEPLLHASLDEQRYGSTSTSTTLHDDDSDEDHIDFDSYIARAQSIGPGTGPEDQTGVFRGPRRYGIAQTLFHGSNYLRKSISTIYRYPVDTEAAMETGDESCPESRYLAGVSESQFWFIFASLTISYFVSCFDGTIVVSSHPIITSFFHSASSASWLSTAFLLTSTAIQLLFGRLSDAVGRKYPYVANVAIFLAGTVWCALAGDIKSFIVARAFCGIGAGGMTSVGAIIISDLVPIEIWSTYQSYMNIVFGAGAASGAALGGAIADRFGWRWEFWIQLPFLVVCLFLAIWMIPVNLGVTDTEQKNLWKVMKHFDYTGSVLLTSAIKFAILGLVSSLGRQLLTHDGYRTRDV